MKIYPKIPDDMPDDWQEAIRPFYEGGKTLTENLQKEYQGGSQIYPARCKVFSALAATPFSKVRAVLLGQDPYHDVGQAIGKSFAVPSGVRPPPSLKNIFKEYEMDLGLPKPENTTLSNWCRNGVLLLNTVLTVRAHCPRSHRGIGWEDLTDAILKAIAAKNATIAFILLGNDAKKCKDIVDNGRHVVFEASHPSPFSANRGFFRSRPFTTVNQRLIEKGAQPIEWLLD